MATERFVNLLIKTIPEFNPRTPYKHGDMFYIPELDRVYMKDMYHECNMPVFGEIERAGRYPWGGENPHKHSDVPQVTYNIRIPNRGTGKGAVVTESMPHGWNKIKKVVFNNPATIVFWQDGTKTVVKCTEGEPYDPEKGLMAAIAKKAFGNLGNYYNQIKKWLPEEEKEDKYD